MRETKWNDKWLFWNSKDAFALVWDIPDIAKEISLPHDAMIESDTNPDSLNGGNTGFYDGGSYTYVKMYTSKPGDRARNIMLRFDGIYMNAFIYVNGQLAANRPYGYSTFYVPISHLLKEEGENEIRIQVRNAAMANSRWYSGSGIYRDVYILEGGATYIKEQSLQVNTEYCSEDEATIKVKSNIVNTNSYSEDLQVSFVVCDSENRIVAREEKTINVKQNGSKDIFSRLYVEKPALWSDENPVLYKVEVQISELASGELLDSSVEVFGIRSMQIDAKNGLRINGKSVKLRGACIHHDSGIIGAKTLEDVEYRRVKILKEAGFNAIRMSHQPAAPALVKVCDELGMYIMDEAFDMWTRAKTDYDYNLYFMDWWKRDIEAMILKDYNHPSVILYSIGNEIPEIGTDEGSNLASDISELCHKLDSTRYTLAAINGVFAAGDAVPIITKDVAGEVSQTDDSVNVNDFMTIMDKYMDKIVVHKEITKRLKKACAGTDIAGYNYMTARYSLDAKEAPNRIIVGSETYPPEIATNWKEVMKYPTVIGDFTWTGWDYLGEAGVGIPAYKWGEGGFGAHYPAKLAYVGDMDITGFRRPLSYYREIVFGLRKAPYIAVQNPAHYGEYLIKTPWVLSDSISSWTYPGFENKSVVVEVYSAGDEVELFLNDESVGKKKLSDDDKCVVRFEMEYQPGNLRAMSYEKGQLVGEYSISTATGKQRLHMAFDKSQKNNSDIVFVNIDVRDASGNVFENLNNEVNLEIEGNGKILAFGSGNPKAQDLYSLPQTTLWNGRALAIIERKTGEKLVVKVSGDDCVTTELSI